MPCSVDACGADAERCADSCRGKHLPGMALRNNRAVAQEDQLVGILRGQVDVVQDRQHRDAFAREPLCPRQHQVLIAQIQAGRGLIQKQAALAASIVGRLPDLGEHARQLHKLPLPPGQDIVGVVRATAQLHRVQGRARNQQIIQALVRLAAALFLRMILMHGATQQHDIQAAQRKAQTVVLFQHCPTLRTLLQRPS